MSHLLNLHKPNEWKHTKGWVPVEGVTISTTHPGFRSPKAAHRRTKHLKQQWIPGWLSTLWPSTWVGVDPWWSWRTHRQLQSQLRVTCQSRRFSETYSPPPRCFDKQDHDGRCQDWSGTPTGGEESSFGGGISNSTNADYPSKRRDTREGDFNSFIPVSKLMQTVIHVAVTFLCPYRWFLFTVSCDCGSLDVIDVT